MKRCTVVSLVSVAVMLFAPAAFAQSVIGEKLDSGLGDMKSAGAYANAYHVAGESLDSGLGDLKASDLRAYTNPFHVAGEKLDSGLGEVAARSAAVIRASY